MASQSTDPTSAVPERIAFEVEGLEQPEPERIEVRGRWLGVRGRRFVRPTLTVLVDGVERRALADLADKPWAAEDGTSWRASFLLDIELARASQVELSVAPDIVVKLVDPSRTKTRRRVTSPDLVRAPRIRTDRDAPPPSLTEHAREIERLNSRLISTAQDLERERREGAKAAEEVQRLRELLQSANGELDRERDRRAGSDKELEEQRSEALRLRAQLGQLQADLDLARVAQSGKDAASAELDETHRTLDRERSEAKQLRSQLAEARERLARAAQQQRQGPRDPRPGDAAPSDLARSEPPTRRSKPRRPSPRQSSGHALHEAVEPPVQERPGRRDRGSATRPERSSGPDHSGSRDDRAASVRGDGAAPSRADRPAPGRTPPPRPERPLNPSLRHRTYWLGRVLALLVMLAVIAAIVLVIRSTGAL